MTKGIDYSKLTSIRAMYDELWNIRMKAEKMAAPVIDDLALLPEVYRLFTEELSSKGRDPADYMARRQFLFIALYLYSPRSLAGGRLPKGLRDRLCGIMGIKSKSSISDSCRNLLFYYREYHAFRDEVDSIYARLSESYPDLVACKEVRMSGMDKVEHE